MPNQSPRLLLVVAAAVFAAACTTTPVEPVEWPEDLPPLSHYEKVYQQDKHNQEVQSREDYLTWVVRFYKGWDLYQDGWDMVTRDTLLAIEDQAERNRVEEKMMRLGKLISSEWAKDSDDRRIRSRELSIWGQALLKSINRNDEEKLVDHVARDVEAILAGELDPIDVNLKRY